MSHIYVTKKETEFLSSFPSVQKIRSFLLRKAGKKEYFSEATYQQYLRAVNSITHFANCQNPDQVIEKLRGNTETVTKLVNGWIDTFTEKDFAPATQTGLCTGLKRFFRVNDIDINWKQIILPKLRQIRHDKAPDKQELRTILMYAPLWLKAAVLVLATSGMRAGSLCKLKVKNVNFDYDPQGQIALVDVPPEANKARVGYYTFIGPEAVNSLKKHLAFREAKGQKLTEDSPLIKPTKGKNLTYPSILNSYNRTLKRASLVKKDQGGFILHLHTLRKFFRSNLEAILTKSQIERLMGHVNTEYLDGSYFRPVEKEMLENYRRALPNLTILQDIQSEDYQKKQLLMQASLVLSGDKLARLKEILARAKSVDDAVQEFRRFREEHEEIQEPRKKTKTAHDGNGKYFVAHNEDEMIDKLHEGFKLVQSLNNDKYLLEATGV
jgi:integrase